jgi:predicted AAA+ superfamily ATPase
MFSRFLYPQLLDAIANSPAVALLGPRQVGKTTLALEVGDLGPAHAALAGGVARGRHRGGAGRHRL